MGRPKNTKDTAVDTPQRHLNDPEAMETAIMVQEQPKRELVLEGDPEAQLQFAMKAANALMRAVSQKPKPVMIRGEQYLEYGDWQTLARFFGATAAIEWTHPIDKGYEARATVLHQGTVISSAEAMCTRDERNWKDRDEFMLRSMAQTRAAAKALRNAYGWVAELAGMKSTPAEEMDGVRSEPEKMAPYEVKKVSYPQMTLENDAHNFPVEESNAKNIIKELLKKLGKEPTTQQAARFDIKTFTGIFWTPGENDNEVINKLGIRLDNADSLQEFDNMIDG